MLSLAYRDSESKFEAAGIDCFYQTLLQKAENGFLDLKLRIGSEKLPSDFFEGERLVRQMAKEGEDVSFRGRPNTG